jgi:hypothetical protein
MNETANNAAPAPRKKYPEGFTFDARQASAMLGISRTQLKRLAEKGVIAPVATKGKVRQTSSYSPDDVDRLIAVGGVQHLVIHRGRKSVGEEGGNRLGRIEGLLRQILDRLDEFQLRPPNGR